MIIVIVVVIISAAVVAALVGIIGRNMIQTMQLANLNQDVASPPFLPNAGSTEVVEHLQTLKRRELLELFFASEVPTDISSLDGDWDGELLENNGMVMTKISGFMTNTLFALGRGRRWAGKKFQGNDGVNRFVNSNKKSADTNIAFDVSIEKSLVQPEKLSVRLVYFNYQSPVSLWKTMIDEVRLVPGRDDVLIGLGCMGWSGGMKNGAPFCLKRIAPGDDKDFAKDNDAQQKHQQGIVTE